MAGSVAASPDAMLAGLRPPVILDEWQEVPELLGAVKRSVDDDPSPGRYILTGSVRAELENQVWPGTGRLLQVPMYGMSVREVRGRASLTPFIDRVIDGGPDTVTAPDDALSVRDYLDLMLAGSFPEPSLRIPAAARRRWFAGYVEQMITRDVPAVAPRRDPELLRRYLSVLAVNTAGSRLSQRCGPLPGSTPRPPRPTRRSSSGCSYWTWSPPGSPTGQLERRATLTLSAEGSRVRWHGRRDDRTFPRERLLPVAELLALVREER